MSTDLRFIMKQLGERLTDVEVDEMLKEADRDNKGRVYYQGSLYGIKINIFLKFSHARICGAAH